MLIEPVCEDSRINLYTHESCIFPLLETVSHNHIPKLLESHIKSIANTSGIILLYHSVSDETKLSLQSTLHNVSVSVFHRHIEDLSPYFTFVCLEEFAQARNKKGMAAITFDDGYRNVIDNAVPILESHNTPCTLFLNPLTFSGQWNWRDKVRYVIQHKLEDQFLNAFTFNYRSGRFYRYSKDPQNNSANIDQNLDKFLENHQIDFYDSYPYLRKAELVIDNQLVSYGNHTQHHYVLSSLDDEQHYREIETAQKALHDIANTTISKCFSAPFGGANDISSLTYDVAESLGYTSILMSQQKLQPNHAKQKNIQVLERFMPRSADIFEDVSCCIN